MACVAVNSLVRTIELEFLQPQPRPIVQQKEIIPCNKDLIQSLHQKLGSLIELLDENRMDGIQAIKDLETKLRDVAFRVEDEIELQIANLYEEEEEPQGDTDAEKSCHSCKLHRILEQAIEDIDAIKEELWTVKMEYKHVIALQGWKTTTPDVLTKSDRVIMQMGDSSSKHASHSEDIMVGKNNEFQIVKKMLIEHSSRQLEIVSIIGMGGIGKTTLAKRLYEDLSIVSHFDKQAWVVASQHHNKRQMLAGLLRSMGYEDSGTEGDLEEHLYHYLMRRRYFVVIDDMWSDKAWDAVKACFPNNGNCSRVLLTTRLAEVATRIGSKGDFSHQMHLLDSSESWNLFLEMACKSRGVEFETIGRPIVEKCKGLPLAIVVVAGLFSKLDTIDEWKNIIKALNSSSTTTVDEECSRVLSLSYNQLSHNLKACFLYLGIFEEDEEIEASSLPSLWAAEGLVKAFEDMSLDEVATRNIQELKERNLILVSESSSCGRKIKTFRMHDLLHSFCVREAQKENLLLVVYENGFSPPPKGFRWVSIQSKNFNIDRLYSFSKNFRSILCFSGVITSLGLKVCSLLRVLLNIECNTIVNLVHLRGLFSRGSCFNILKPFRAWNIQTLHMHMVDEINFLEFPQLKHFKCFTTPSDFPIFFHQNLESIYGLQPYQCTEELFKNIPCVKRVKVGCEGDWNECIKNLDYLHQLEGLYLAANSYSMLMGQHVIPNKNHIVGLKNIKKLTIDFMKFEWKAINNLSKLSKLEVLKLSFCECMGEQWKLLENENFSRLVYLKIGMVDGFKHWKASAYHFPKLDRLILYWCKELEEIPTHFAEISALQSIELNHCLPSAVASAKQIQDEQHDQGNENMMVIEIETLQPAGSDDEDEFDELEPYSNKRKWSDNSDEDEFDDLEE